MAWTIAVASCLVCGGLAAASSPDGVWTSEESAAVAARAAEARLVHVVDRPRLEAVLALAPLEFSAEAQTADVRLSLPMPDGSYRVFRIEDSPIMDESLAAYLGYRSFSGRGVDDPTWTVRFDTSSRGFRALALGDEGAAVFIEPEGNVEDGRYVAIDGATIAGGRFQCLLDATAGSAGALPMVSSGARLRRYRLAVAATGEFTQFFGSEAAAITAIGNTVNAVNAIYQRDVAVRLDLIANEAAIVYDDPTSDPFPLANLNT